MSDYNLNRGVINIFDFVINIDQSYEAKTSVEFDVIDFR